MGQSFLAIRTAALIVLLGTLSLQGSIDRGTIQGTITDEHGALIPGAQVMVKNTETNVEIKLKTNSAGFYLAPELVPGTYSVRVESQGFSPLSISNARVKAGSTTTADATLQVGAVSQHIDVAATVPLVENTPDNFTTTLTTNYIQDIPLQGRDIQSLVQLIPGMTQSSGPSGSLFGFDSQFGGFPDPLHLVGSGVSSNGAQGGAVAWFLDGSLNAALGPEAAVVNPSPDAVAEFSVVNNGLGAEWGRTSGGVINIVLKSGTNAVHGDVYALNRNSHFNASNPFARRDASGQPFLQPRVNFNNPGGTLGGPVYFPRLYNGNNRTFFFLSYDVSFLHENKPTLLTVPLSNERLGDFRGDPRFATVCGANGATNCLYDPYSTTGPDANGQFHRTPFLTPVIPAGRIDPLSAFYLASYPNPNFVDPLQQDPSGCGLYCNNYIGSVGSSQTTHNSSIKIDHVVTDKHHLFGEWLFNPSYYDNYRYPWNGPTAQTTTGIAGAQPYRTINQIFALGLTSMIRPTLINEARVMFSRQNQISDLNSDATTGTSQVLEHIKGLNLPLNQFRPSPLIYVGGVGGFGPQPWQNAHQGEQAYTFIDNMTLILGKHTLKTGLMFRRDNAFVIWDWPLGLSFGGGLTADPNTGQGGTGLAQFLLGAVDQGSGSGVTTHPWQSNDYWGTYLQDEYRIASNLTLSLGLRYDLFGWFRERRDNLANLNLSAPNPDVPYNGRIDYFGTSQHPDRNVFPAHKTDLAPRVGLSWAPFSDRKTVIRASYGIIYSNSINAEFGSGMGAESSPAYGNSVGYHGDLTYERPAFQFSQGAPDLGLPDLNLAKQTNNQFLGKDVGFFLRGSRDPYVQQWSFYIERELPADMMISVGYVGTHGLHLIGDEFRNYDYIPTATRLQLRNNINQPVAVDASLGSVYGCPVDSASGKTMCPGNIGLLPYPQYRSISANVAADGFNRYNGLHLKAEKRLGHGLYFLVAYTVQKNIESANMTSLIGGFATPSTVGRSVGRASLVRGGSGGPAGPLAAGEDPDNRSRYISLAPDDVPQVLNIAVNYDLPLGKGKPFLNRPGPVEKVLGGWKLVQNWNFQRGVPMVFSAPGNGISGLPNLIGDPSKGRGSKTRQQLENQWYDPAAFEAPFGSDPALIKAVSTGVNPDGTPVDFNTLDAWWRFGNSGMRPPTGRAPGFWNVDMTLAKDFHLSEAKYFQLRWEVLNAFNHQNLGLPDTNWCLPPNSDGSVDAIHQFGCQFGRITNVQTDPRAMQFGLKFFW